MRWNASGRRPARPGSAAQPPPASSPSASGDGTPMAEEGARATRAVPEDLLGADPPWRNVDELVRDAAARGGDRDALRFEGERLSFVELEQRTARLAAVFATRGIGTGDRVAMMIPNSLSFPLC